MKRIFSIVLSCCMILESAIARADPHRELLASVREASLNSSKRLAQRENCLKYDRTVNPSTQTRTVALKQFGIKIQIPENYKTLLRNDGSVMILNPVDYDLIACTTRGGYGGRGFYHSFVKSIPNPKNLPLESFARSQYKSDSFIELYKSSDLQRVLVDIPSPAFRSSAFFVKIPGLQNIVQIGAGCDCDISPADVKRFLQTVSLL